MRYIDGESAGRAMYSEAVGPVEFDRAYTETDVLIEVMEDDTEKEGEYARDNFENCWKQYHSLGANDVMDAEAPNK